MITLAILLLLLFGLSFWLLKESRINIYIKLLIIFTFFSFCVLVPPAFKTYMGWPASPTLLPEIVTIYNVVIKEPSQQLNTKGGIYFLIEHPATKYDVWWLNLFGYETKRSEPRLFRLPYSRKLHEDLEKNVIPKTRRGQTVTGKINKLKGNGASGEGNEGTERGQGRDGNRQGKRSFNGGESLETEYMFYVLPPSQLMPKE
jgi:hypothetical protein